MLGLAHATDRCYNPLALGSPVLTVLRTWKELSPMERVCCLECSSAFKQGWNSRLNSSRTLAKVCFKLMIDSCSTFSSVQPDSLSLQCQQHTCLLRDARDIVLHEHDVVICHDSQETFREHLFRAQGDMWKGMPHLDRAARLSWLSREATDRLSTCNAKGPPFTSSTKQNDS